MLVIGWVLATAVAHDSEAVIEGKRGVPGWGNDLGEAAIDESDLSPADRPGETFSEVVCIVVVREHRSRAPRRRDVVPPSPISEDLA
jgi:hypothetical protein